MGRYRVRDLKGIVSWILSAWLLSLWTRWVAEEILGRKD